MDIDNDGILLQRKIVMDSGSHTVRIGYEREDFPKLKIPNLLGTPKYKKALSETPKTYVGQDAVDNMGLLSYRRPYDPVRGFNIDDQEQVWHHCFQKLDLSPDSHVLVLSISPSIPRKELLSQLEVLLETEGFYAVVPMETPPLALFSTGSETGLVLDAGASQTTAVPVCRGFTIRDAIQSGGRGGNDVTDSLIRMLAREGVKLDGGAGRLVAESVKEARCYVAPSKAAFEKSRILSGNGGLVNNVTMEPFTLPDGTVLTDQSDYKHSTVRWADACPEILFSPSSACLDSPGAAELVWRAIGTCDPALRQGLWSNIVLTGGTTLLKGYPERLSNELRGLKNKAGTQNSKQKQQGTTTTTTATSEEVLRAPANRDISVWVGGSVVSALELRNLYLTRANYRDSVERMYD